MKRIQEEKWKAEIRGRSNTDALKGKWGKTRISLSFKPDNG